MARLLVVWNAAVTCGLAVVVCRQLVEPAAAAPRVMKFDELDAQRINIVEPDGKPRMILASAARYPGVFWDGKEYPHPGRTKGGLLYFNERRHRSRRRARRGRAACASRRERDGRLGGAAVRRQTARRRDARAL
ncbi:MAG TPA: hypothetical protein VGG74_36100 [Kofleriaceae bacterium]|jgi:hypothetical protein